MSYIITMSVDSIDTHKKEILKCIHGALAKQDVFASLDELFNAYFNRSCSSMLELRKRNQKNKGELFEVFCMMYLNSRGYECWMLRDVPEDILKLLNLSRQDVGIDLVARVHQTSKTGEPQILNFAVQCKYRSPSKNSTGKTVHRVGWKDISTFLSYCTRTGPWTKHIIMTNAESVCWKGKKTNKDYTIARGTFAKQPSTYWCTWLQNSQSYQLNSKEIKEESDTKEENNKGNTNSKELRLKWLNEKFL